MGPGATKQQENVIAAVLNNPNIANVFAKMLEQVGDDPAALAQYSRDKLEAVRTELPAAPAFASELLELVLSNYKLHASNEPCPRWGHDPRRRGLLGGGVSESDIVTNLSIRSCARLSKASHEFPFLINLDIAGTIRSGRLPVVNALLEVLLDEVVYCYATNNIQRNKIPEVAAELRDTLVEKELVAQVKEVRAAMDTLYREQSEALAKVIAGCSKKNNELFPVVTWSGIERPSDQIEMNRDRGYDEYLYLNGMAVIERSLELAAFADSKVFGELLSLVSEFPMLKVSLFPEIYGFFLYIKNSSDLELLAKKIKDEPSATLTFRQEDKEAKQNLTIEDILSVAPMVD